MTDTTAGETDDTAPDPVSQADAAGGPETDTDHAEDTDLDAASDDGENGDETAAEDLFEVEHDGQKYRVPAALKDQFLMRADYSRKTEDLANQRKSFDRAREQEVRSILERQASVERLHEAHKSIVDERMKLGVAEAQLEGYDQLIRQARDRARTSPDQHHPHPHAGDAQGAGVLHQKLNFVGSINREYDDSFAKTAPRSATP
jgi:hypothetical protein